MHKRETVVRDARNGSAVTNDCCHDRMIVIKSLARLEVGRVQILRTMRKEVETCMMYHTLVPSPFVPHQLTGHEKYSIQTQSPVRFQHRPYLMDEYFGLLPSSTTGCTLLLFRTEKHLAFWNKSPNSCCKGGNA